MKSLEYQKKCIQHHELKEQPVIEKIKQQCIKHNATFQKIEYDPFDADVYLSIAKQFETSTLLLFSVRELLPEPDFWQSLNNILRNRDRKAIVISDNIHDNQQWSSQYSQIQFFSVPELIYVSLPYYLSEEQTEVLPKKKLFNCLINRVESVRQSWFYFLYLKDLLDKGYVSFLLEQPEFYFDDNVKRTKQEIFEYNHYTFNLDQLSTFQQAFENLKQRVPYKNFEEPEPGKFHELCESCKYSLTLDTYATRDDHGAIIVTDKVIRSLQLYSIPLFFSQKGTAHALDKLGLKIEPAMLELDNLDWTSRQQKLLNILEDDAIIQDTTTVERINSNRQTVANWGKVCYNDSTWEQIFFSVTDF